MQTILVIVLLLGAGIYVIRRLYHNVKGRSDCGCGACASDCTGAEGVSCETLPNRTDDRAEHDN